MIFNQKKDIKINFMNLILKLIIIISIVKQILTTSCEYDTPILQNNVCTVGGCTSSQFNESICKINNSVIQTQWLNNIIPVSSANYIYLDIITTLNGDLLIESSSFPEENKRLFYGLKKNGREFFNDTKTLTKTPYCSINTSLSRYEAFIFSIKLNGEEDNKEYLISVPKDDDKNLELYDFYQNIVYEEATQTFFDSQVFTFDSNAIKINSKDNYYILGICGRNWDPSENNYFYLIKFLFTSKDLNSNNPIISKTRTYSSKARIVSCFEIESNYIICFYQNELLHYVIGVYDQDLNNKISLSFVVGSSSIDDYFKAIHFRGNAGAFGYYNKNENENHFYISFKYYKNDTNSILDYFMSNLILKINKAGSLFTEILFNDQR